MKKLFLPALFFICIFVFASGCASCSDAGSGDSAHAEHTFDRKILTQKYLKSPATCTVQAEYFYSCRCGERGGETFVYGKLASHRFGNYISDGNASCAHNLTETAVCENCTATDTREIPDSKKHEFINYVRNNDGTCTKNCTETAVCEKCTATDTREAEDSKIHSYEGKVCIICGEGYATQGLEYELNADGKGYSVNGRGIATDTEVYIPATYKNLPVTGINGYAFSVYASLKRVFIGENVVSISTQAFLGCGRIESITVAGNNKFYKSIDGNLYSKDGTVFLRYTAGKKQSSFILPDGVEEIGGEAFRDCNNLTEIYIPETVKRISDSAFYDCNKLIAVTVAEGNKEFKSIDGNLYGGGGTVFILHPAGKAEASFAVPDGVKTIGANSFTFSRNLISITLPAGIETIGRGAFNSCISLTTVTVPKGVKAIADKTFYNCNSLVSVFLPDGIESIGEYAFLGCIRLKSLTIPDGVEEIGANAFLGCSAIQSVTVPNSVKVICYDAFSGCNSIETVYYRGTEAQWRNIEIVDGNTLLTDATVHFLSEMQAGTVNLPFAGYTQNIAKTKNV